MKNPIYHVIHIGNIFLVLVDGIVKYIVRIHICILT